MEIIAFIIIVSAIGLIFIDIILKKIRQCRCNHNNKFTHVQRSYATCEDIVVTCLECEKILETKTDCR